MSSLIVEVCVIDNVIPHPNADRLELAKIKGWVSVVGKDQFKAGDKCIYVPPDAILPAALAAEWGVANYLGALNKLQDGTRPEGGRVKVARLRGEPSYGLVMPCKDDSPVGTDVAEKYGIQKWEPPIDATTGLTEAPHPLFHKYTEIENYRNFPDLFNRNDIVSISEKIHGGNCRLASIYDGEPILMAGSHNQRTKEFDAKGRKCRYWSCFTQDINDLLLWFNPNNNIIIFGEVFGSGVQDLHYGHEGGKTSFRVFDISLNGKYLDCQYMKELCDKFNIPTVTVLYTGNFDPDMVEKLATGPTTVCDPAKAGKFNEREGIVIKHVIEQPRATEKKVFNRCVLKAINFNYLNRKGGTENH